jgi:hypothetical protein
MKKCLQCEQVYGDETNFCLSDGSTLVSVSGSFTAPGETPTVFGGAPVPTAFHNPSFTAPVPSAPPAASKGNTLLIALGVGLVLLLIGGAVIGLLVYGLSSAGKKDPNTAANSNAQTNKNISAEQKSGNDNLSESLKQQQEKLEKDRQKLEDERKALEAKKKEAATPPKSSSSSTAAIIDPPSNIRSSPNGAVLCVARTRGTIVNILGSTGVYDNNGEWYYTDYCGSRGVIHSSQIRF